MRRIALAALSVSACGRLGFGSQPSGDAAEIDAPIIDAPPDGPPMLLACGAPTRLTIGGGLAALTAVATPNGFEMFAVDGAGNLTGSAFEFQGGGLVSTVDQVGLGTNQTGTIGAITMGSQTLLATLYGRPAPTGTKLEPLSAQLIAGAGSMRESQIGGDGPIAANGTSYLFATVETTKRVDGHIVDAHGTDVGSPVTLVDAAEAAGNVTVERAGTGFLVSYVSGTPSPNEARIELVDAHLARTAGPVTTSNAPTDALNPRATWAPVANQYLVAWYDKDSLDGDDVWYQIRGPNLEVITQPAKIGPQVYAPIVIADAAGTGFWIAYRSYAVKPDQVIAAHIDAAGVLVPRPVTSSGGTVDKLAFVERDGQPVLVWTETGGTGPDLYLDPMCGG